MKEMRTINEPGFDPAGWRQYGGGSRYSLLNGVVSLHYRLEGWSRQARSEARAGVVSERPWKAVIGRDTVTDAIGRARTFGSAKAALRAARKAL